MHLRNLIFQQEGKSEILALEIRQQEFPILKGQRARKLCRIKYLTLSSPRQDAAFSTPNFVYQRRRIFIEKCLSLEGKTKCLVFDVSCLSLLLFSNKQFNLTRSSKDLLR